jgi:hypothetical protein
MGYQSILNSATSPTGLPILATFSVPQGSAEQALLISGSAWSGQANQILQIEVLIGATLVTTIQFFSNGNNTHRAFAPVFLPLQLAPGTNYTLTLREPDAQSTTTTDKNDWFSAMLLT